jgi:Zn-dependent M28 family amino/carboxypeptidase
MPTPSRRGSRLASLVVFAGAALAGTLSGWSPALAAPGVWAEVTDRTTPAGADTNAADAAVYRQHIFTLANPWFEGRCPGDRGNADAADYIEFHFKKAGLSPAFPEGEKAFSSYLQYFVPRDLRGGKITAAKEELTLNLPGGAKKLVAGTDMRALALSGTGKFEGGAVFVGYGIAEGKDGYAGFTGGADLKGKAAIVLRFEPMNEKGESRWAEGSWSPKADLNAKINECFTRGAAAVVVVNPPGADDERVNRLMNFTEVGANGRMPRNPAAGPVMMLGNQAAEAFVSAADANGRSLRDLRNHADASGEMIDLPKATLAIEAEIVKQEQKTANVGGVLRGKGALADEWVVIGAHYDHVGYGNFGSMSGSTGVIHPGADDNASGTSAILTMAGKMAAEYAKLPENASCRSVLFLAFSAEESGLEGSRYYTQNMIAPREKHYFMINMDMVGRLREDPPLEVSGLGVAAGLADWLDPYWKAAGFPIRPLVKRSQFDDRSDHASFRQVKIPAVFFFTGLHEDYHRPIDTADKINIEGAAKIVDLGTRIAMDAASRTEPLVFGTEKKPEDQPAAEKPAEKPAEKTAEKPAEKPAPAPKPEEPAGDESTGPSVGLGSATFGLVPGDYADDKDGVLVGGVSPGKPAEKAGLKTDDRLIKWNDVVLKDIQTFTAQLRAAKPGDVVKITYIRNGKEATTDVTLVKRN